jgi:uncharacterized membrane protein (DUF2068 family)
MINVRGWLMKQRNTLFLKLIAVFKLVKAISLIALGIGAIRLGHSGDPTDKLSQMVLRLGFNPGGRYLDHFLAMVSHVSPERYKELGIGSFVYAALFLTEGTGLWLGKRWGEWFTVIITSSLVPLEVFEIVRHPSATKVVVLVLNVAIVVYLLVRIQREKAEG